MPRERVQHGQIQQLFPVGTDEGPSGFALAPYHGGPVADDVVIRQDPSLDVAWNRSAEGRVWCVWRQRPAPHLTKNSIASR